MTTFEDFQTYLEGIPPQIIGLESMHIVLDWLDIMELQLDRAKYPALVVEMPDITLDDVGGAGMEFDFAWSIIKAVPADDPPSTAKQAMSDTLEIALTVNKIFFCDSEADEEGFDSELSNQLQPIIKATPDNCCGWRGNAKIKIYRIIA